MAKILAVVLTVVAIPAFGQIGAAPLGARNGALGGGAAVANITHPLGGFSNGFVPGMHPGHPIGSNNNNHGYNSHNNRRTTGYPYAYSVWVPDYFDYLDASTPYGYGYDAGYAPQSVPAAPQQPVIINQYFSGPAPEGAQPLPQGAAEPPQTASSPRTVTPGDPIGTPENYYLIAYKDHAIYAALAYWMEDKTLNYVTTQNTHNQASLDLIDVPLTKKLNEDRNVTFAVPGQ